ncbi:MAG: hypothetical protein RL433_249 [Actinomycetota bacterium]|jgi:hypothetical protein
MKKMLRLSSAIAAVALVVSPLSVAQAEDEAVEATSIVLSTMPLTEVLNLSRAGFDDDLGDYDIFTYLFMEVWGAKPLSAVGVISDGYVPLTAFIPTDRAFRKLTTAITGKVLKNESVIANTVMSLGVKAVEQVLLYHVVLGAPIESPAALQANGAVLTSANDQTFKVNVSGTVITLVDKDKTRKNAVVLLGKVDINSGHTQVAHGINQVMLPKLS